MPVRTTRVAGSALISSFIFLTLTSLVACGGAQKGAAAPESDPWAGYQGTFATPANGPSQTASAKSSKPGAKAKDAETAKAEPAPEATPEPAPATEPAKPAKKAAAKKAAGKPKTASK